MLRFRRPAVALLLLLTFWPTMALGQAPKAGVVTTLEGNVSAARRALPQPIPLKFKDDVFLRDKITTGDQSLARLLLGGKAIVTIRERSILTVTELPGRSTVDLESGKIGLAVARDRMRQGEVIDVRTPNAIVAVRGTVLIAEVSRVTAQAGGTPPAPVTEVHLVSGTAEATVPGRPPFTLNEFQKFRVTGTAPPVIGTFTAGDLGQIQSGLKPKGPQHQEAANADQVKGQLLAATATLLTTVLGGGAELVEPVVLPPSLPTPVAEILPGGEENLAELVSNIPPNIIINPALSAFANLAASAPTPVVQTPSGTSLAIPGSAFEVQATGGTPGDLTRPLFDATNSNLAIGANLLNVLGTLNVVVAPDPVTGNPPPPVLSFDPTTITTGGDFIRVASGGTLSVNSSLVSDTGGTLSARGHFINVVGGGTLTGTGPSPLVQLNNTTVTAAGDFLRVGDEGAGLAITAGQVLNATGANLTVGGSLIRIAGPGPFGEDGEVLPGSVLVSTASLPLLQLSSVTVLSKGGDVVRILDGGLVVLGGAGSLLADTGGTFNISQGDVLRINNFSNLVSTSALPLLEFTGSNVQVPTRGEGAGDLVRVRESSLLGLAGPLLRAFDTTFELGGILLRVVHDSALTMTSEASEPPPLIQLSGGHLSVGSDLVRIGSPSNFFESPDTSSVEVAGGLVSLRNFPASDDSDFVDRVSGALLRVSKDSSLSAGGPILDMENAHLTLGNELAFVDRGSITTTTAAPFARITDSSLTAGGSLLAVDAGSVELHGPFLTAVQSAITATNAVGVFDGASVTGHSSLPFLSLDASTLAIVRNALEGYGGDLVIVGAGEVSTPPATLTIVGGLLSLLNESEVDVAGNLVNVTNNGRLTVTATSSSAPLLQLSGATVHSTAGDVVRVENGGALSLLSAGPLLVDAGSTFTLDEGDVLRLNDLAALTSASAQPLLQFTGSTVQARAGGESTGVGDLVRIRESSSMELHGSLLRASDTIFELAGMLLRVVHDSSLTVTGEGSDPLIQLSGGSVSTGNDLVRIGSPELSDDGSRVTVPGAFVSLRNFPAGSLDIGSGTLLRIHGASSLSAGGPIFDLENVNLTLDRALALLERGSTITTAGPFAKISGGSLTADVLIGTDGVDNTINLTGGLLDLSNTTVTLGRVAGPGSCDCTPTDTFTQTLGLNEPAVKMSNSNLSLTEFGAPLVEFAGPDAASTSQGGVALIATNTSGAVKTLSLLGPLLLLSGVTLTDPNAQIQLSGMTVTQNGSANELIEAFNLPITVRGPLLTATNSPLHIDFDVIGASDLTSTGAGALITLQNSPLTSAGGGILAASNANLTGSLLTATNSPITLDSDVISVGTLTGAGTAPLVTLSSSPLTATGRLLGVSFLESGAVELAGPLLDAVNSGVTLDDNVIEVVGLTSTGAGPLISLQNSPLTSSENLLSGSGSIGFVLGDGIVLPGSASLHGSLLAATTSPITLDGAVAFLGSLASTGTGALVSLQSSPLTATGAMVVANSVTLAGPALAATDSSVTLGGPVLSIANLTSTGTAPLVSLQNSPLDATGVLVTDSGLAGSGNVIGAPQVRQATLASPLLAATDSAVTMTEDAITVPGGATLSSSTTQAFLSLSGSVGPSSASSSLTAGGSLLAVNGGSAAFQGPFLSAVRSDVTATNAIGVFDGGSVTSSSASPFLSFDASTLTIHDLASEGYGGDLVIVGAGGVPGGTLSLNGRLLDLSNASVVTVAGSLIDVTNGGQLTVTGLPQPFIKVGGGSSLSVGEAVLEVAFASFVVPAGHTLVSVTGGSSLVAGSVLDLTGTSLDLTGGTLVSLSGTSHLATTVGPFARISGASLTADSLITADNTGNTVHLTGSLLNLFNATVTLNRVGNGGHTDILTLTLQPNEPIIRMSSSTLTLGPDEPLISLGVDAAEPSSQSGVALIATNGSAIALQSALLDLGGVVLIDPNPQVQVTDSTVSQSGAGALITVFGPPVTASGPLLKSNASTIGVVRGSLLFVNGPFSVSGAGVGALLQFTDSSVFTGTEVVFVGPGSTLTLDRGLVDALRTTFVTGGFDTFFAVARGATVNASTTSPFISLDGGTVTMQPVEDFIHIGTFGGEGSAVLTLMGGGSLVGLKNIAPGSLNIGSGSLLHLSGSDLTVGGSVLEMINSHLSLTGPVARFEGGSVFATTAGPVVKITGGSLTADLLASSDGAGNVFNLTGTLFDLTNANVTLRQIAEEPVDSTDVVTFNLALNQPFIRMVASTLTTSGLNADLIEFGDNLPLSTNGARRTTQGTALIATGSTLNLKGSLLRLHDIDSMADAAFIQLASTTINQTDTLRALVVVDPGVGTTTMTAPLLTASNSTIGTSGAFALFRNGQLTSNTTSPFISFNPSTLTSARHILLFDDGISATLNGSLLSAQNTVFNATSDQFSAFTVIDGASVTTTGTSDPLLTFVGTAAGLSKVTAARVFLPLATSSPDRRSPSMTLSGPLVSATLTDFKTGNSALNTFPFLFVGDGATLAGPQNPGSGAAPPLVTFSTSSLEASGGFLTLRRSRGSADVDRSRVILDGSLLEADTSTFTTFSSAHPAGVPCCSFVFIGEGAELTDTRLAALLRFNNSVFPNIGGSLVSVVDSAGQLDSVSRPAFMSLAGGLVQDFGGQYTLNGSVLRIRNGSEVRGSGSDAFLSFTNSTLRPSANGNMSLLSQGSINATNNGGFGDGDPRNITLLSLAGALLFAQDSMFDTGTFSTFIGIRDGASVVSSSGTGAFIQLMNSTVTASGNFFAASQFRTDSNNQPITGSRAPITVTLARPLLSARASDINAIFGLVSVGDNTTFTSTTPNALIDLFDSRVSVGGAHPIPGQPSVDGRLFNLFERGGAAPSMTLAGPLFSGDLVMGEGPGILAAGDVFGVFRASLRSDTTEALLRLSRTAVRGDRTFFIATGFPSGVTSAPPDAASTPTPVSFGGPFLVATDSVINTSGNFLSFTFGAAVGGGAGNAFADLLRTNITTTVGAGAGHFLELCCGTPAATVTFQGSLLAGTDSNLNLAGSLADISNGATLVTSPRAAGTYPLVALVGGSLVAANIFTLGGLPRNVVDDFEVDPVTNRQTGLRIGQDRPLQHGGGGALLDTFKEATVNVSGSVATVVDAQLLAATLPALVNLTGGTALTTGSHAVDLVQNAKFDVGLADVVRLTNSTMTVLNGHLLNVNASRVNAGTLAALAGGSTLNVLNGALLNLMNGGIANFATSLVSFTGTLNTINVTNSFVPTITVSGIPIFVAPGAIFNHSISPMPFVGLTGNTINVTGSLVAVQGTGGSLKIGTGGTSATIVGTAPPIGAIPPISKIVSPPTGGGTVTPQ